MSLDKHNCILKFTTKTCVPCKMMAPTIEKVAHDLGLPIIQVDVEENPHVALEYDVMGVPTYIRIKDSQVSNGHTGSASYEKLMEKLS